MGLAQFHDLGKHVEEGDDQRKREKAGDASAEHIDAIVLLQLHDLGVHLVALGIGDFVLLVALFDGVHLGLDALHLQRAFHGCDTEGQGEEIDEDGEDDDGPAPGAAPAGEHVVVDEVQGEEEGFADDAPEAELKYGLERDFGIGGVDAFEDIDQLGADEDAGLGGAAGVADGGAEDGHLQGLVEPALKPVRLRVLETSSWLRRVTTLVVAGESGRKTAAKKGSLTPAKSNGPLSVSPLLTFLGSMCSKLPLRSLSNCALV